MPASPSTPATSASWRTRSVAVLPLAFLQSLAFGFIELPVVFLFRQLECEAYVSRSAPHIPEDDVCRDPAVQKAYSTDMAIYLVIATVVSIAVSGPFGRLSDVKGRKIVMVSGGLLNAIGDIWLCLSATLPPIRTPYSLLVSALIKGLGGSFSVVQAAHSAFVADTSSTSTRSFYLGYALVMFWIASAIAPLGCAVFLAEQRYSSCFAIAFSCWATYVMYALFVLKETRTPSEDRKNQDADSTASHGSRWTPRVLLHSLTEPLVLIFGGSTLRWLAITNFAMLVAIGAFSVLVIYCDLVFGMSPMEAGLVVSIMSISRACSVACVLPAFLFLYRKFYLRKQLEKTKSDNTNESSERAPLLDGPATRSQEMLQKLSATQELLVSRTCFCIDAIGMILISLSRNSRDVTIATALGSLGAPATPSLQALVTLAAPSSEIGRILAGFSIIECAGVALRNPIMFGIYGATLRVAPRTIWFVASGLFMFCAIVVIALRPARFVTKNSAAAERAPQQPQNDGDE
ncbi:MFS general substrate transporter [Panus rudis PR-1116 ss-1]|nr:MFS general substrate transporter [Panus rudis PR-1116 ss-1]